MEKYKCVECNEDATYLENYHGYYTCYCEEHKPKGAVNNV